MTDRELMQQALDALEAMQNYAAAEKKGLRICDEAIEALRVRLAQPEPKVYTDIDEMFRDMGIPEQEPVAWADRYDLDREGHDFWVSRQANVRTGVPLYTAQPQQHSEQWWKHEVSNAWAEGYEKGRASVKQPEQEKNT